MQLSRWNDYNFESRQFAFKIVIIFCRHFCYIFKLLIIDITCPESFFLHRNTHFEASKCNSYRLLNEGEKVPWNFLTLTNKLLQFTPYIDLILAALVIRWYFFLYEIAFLYYTQWIFTLHFEIHHLLSKKERTYILLQGHNVSVYIFLERKRDKTCIIGKTLL